MKKIVLSLSMFMPMVTFAADVTNQTLLGLVAVVQSLLQYVVPVLITLAVVYFVWGIIKYSFSSEDDDKKKARGIITQGLIGLFVIIAFWGILAIVKRTFGVGSNIGGSVAPCTPQVLPNGTIVDNC